ncbi:MAG: hypothetical protein ACXVZL_08615 [Gaiellaceae bacterium]
MGVLAMAGAPVAAARGSGQEAPVRRAVLAGLAFLGAVAVGALVFGALVDDVLPALVLGIAVGGSVALRTSSPRAGRARVVAVGVIVVLAILLAGSTAGILALALLALPAIAAADALV